MEAAAGITGLTCNETRGWCTTDLRCEVSANCTFSGFEKCTDAGICVPPIAGYCIRYVFCDFANGDIYKIYSEECTDDSNCTTIPLTYCDTQTIQGIDVDLCSPEPCDVNTTCESNSTVCFNNICTLECEDDSDCDFGLDNAFIDSTGLTCNLETGLCSTFAPTTEPTSNPSESPTGNTMAPSMAPTGIDESTAVRYGVISVFTAMVMIVLWME